jgi:hypothetical protein
VFFARFSSIVGLYAYYSAWLLLSCLLDVGNGLFFACQLVFLSLKSVFCQFFRLITNFFDIFFLLQMRLLCSLFLLSEKILEKDDKKCLHFIKCIDIVIHVRQANKKALPLPTGALARF